MPAEGQRLPMDGGYMVVMAAMRVDQGRMRGKVSGQGRWEFGEGAGGKQRAMAGQQLHAQGWQGSVCMWRVAYGSASCYSRAEWT